MIDGIKILSLPVDRDSLWENLYIEPHIPTNAKTGEITTKAPQAEYKGLSFTFYPLRVEVSGSLHVFANDGLHNYNDFTRLSLENVVIELKHRFKFNPENTIINSLEIGVNLELPFNPEMFLRSMIMHNGEPFTYQKDRTKRFRECSHTQFFIKAYDKGRQYKLNRHILRFEVKFIKMEKINKEGIKTLADLIKPGNFERLGRILLNTFDSVLTGNIETEYSNLNRKDRELFLQGHNPAYWETIKPTDRTSQDYKRDYKRYERKLKRFKELLTITGADTRQREIRQQIIKKIDELTHPEKRGILTDTTPGKTGEIDREPTAKKRGKLTDTEKPKTGEIDRLLYRGNLRHLTEPHKTICSITGIDISGQKKGSKFLSAKTVREMYFTDPATFIQLSKQFGSKRPHISREKQCYFIAHNIRNKYSRLNPTQKINAMKRKQRLNKM